MTASISDAYYLAPIHSSLSFKDTLPFLNQSLKRMCVWEREGESERQGEWETEIQLLGFVIRLRGYRVWCVLLHTAIKQTVVGVLRDEEFVLFT